MSGWVKVDVFVDNDFFSYLITWANYAYSFEMR